MQDSASFFPEDIYPLQLSRISGISFTRREVDVMACLLGARKTSKIAYFLSVDPRTIETHVRNITLKIECNTREGIIDFLEHSDKVPFLRKHYIYIQIESAFKKSLKDISRILQEKRRICILGNKEEEQASSSTLSSLLTPHLKCAGFEVTHEPATYEGGYLIYVLPVDLQEIPSSFIAILNRYPKEKTLFLLTIGKEDQKLPKELKGFKGLKAAKYANYYLYVLEILKTFFPGSKIDPIISNFKEKYEKVSNPAQLDPPRLLSSQIKKEKSFFLTQLLPIMSSRKWFTAMVLIIIFCISVGFLSFYWQAGYGPRQHSLVLSELPLPTKSVFLERPELLLEIDRGFNQTGDIQTVALVGIGGAGKTTLARQYAHRQEASIIWEINAETSEALYESFEKLALALARTEKDKKVLKEVEEIKNSTQRTEQLIHFVKEHLKLENNWFLIYDNVESLENIQKYLPRDANRWGGGKLLLTTRNTNAQNTPLVRSIIFIGELTPQQKQELFTKIMSDEKSRILQDQDISAFLKHIPPFPLDVSVAAYYLKMTNIPYAQYLEKLENYTKETNELHENILKETGEYTKTRYAIITHSLEHLLTKDKNFADLLLFISLLNAQNIPKSLLDQYKDSSIVDNFIYHLKKHSLITVQSMPTSSDPLYSIHRSTQTISFSYLTELLKLNKDSPLLTQIANALDDYADKIIEQEDFPTMQIMAQHIEKFLNNSNLLRGFSKGLLESKLGVICYFINGDKSNKLLDGSLKLLKMKSLEHLSSEERSRLARALLPIGAVYTELRLDKEAKELLEKTVQIYGKENSKNYIDLSRTLSHLGDLQKRLGNYEEARDYLEESIRLHKQYGVDKKRIARSLAYLGSVYRGLGFYQKAAEKLEEGLAFYKKNYPNDHIRIGWILIHLGNVHRRLGNLKQAKGYLEKGFLIFQKHFSENHVSMGLVLAYLGGCYRELGDYEKSRNYLEKSLRIHQKHFNENSSKIGWILFHLASTYKTLGYQQEAQKFFDKVFEIYANHCNDENIETARCLRNMAQICLEKNRLDEADSLIKRSLKILQSRHHVEAYRALKTLGEILLKKSIQPTYAKNSQESQGFKNQAIEKLNQALQIAEQHFPQGSIHIQKIRARIKSIKE